MKPERDIAQRYINNFRRAISRSLNPGVGIQGKVYLAESGGGVIELEFGNDFPNTDDFEFVSSISEALSKISQHAFSGDTGNIHFGGTNTILEGNRIILIKDSGYSEWDENAASRDVDRATRPIREREN